MSQENVEIVCRHFEATDRRDFAAAMEGYAENVVLVVGDGVVPTNAGTFNGREVVGEWFTDWLRSFERDYRFQIEEARTVGERVLVVARHHGHGRVSGVTVDSSQAYIYTVAAGKITRVELYATRPEALKAVGLDE